MTAEDGSESGPEPVPEDRGTQIDCAVDRIRTRGEAVRTEQLERALDELGAEAELREEQLAAVERLSERLVDRLLAVPLARLRRLDAEGDPETVATALAIFSQSDDRSE